MRKLSSVLLTLLFVLLQCTYACVQTLCGLVLLVREYLFHGAAKANTTFFYHGAVVTVWNKSGSLSLGLFIFLAATCYEADESKLAPPRTVGVLVHEYGHFLQSLLLGPLYLPLIGMPSFCWCNLPALRRLYVNGGKSYYDFFTESCANKLGSRFLGSEAPQR